MWTKQYTKKKQKYCKPCISLINQEPIMEDPVVTWSQRGNKKDVEAKSEDFLFDEDEDIYGYEGWDEQ